MKVSKLNPSGCSSCGDDDRKHKNNDNHNHDDHDHSDGSGDFNLKEELIPIGMIVALLTIGIIFEDKLHDSPYSWLEYLIFIPAYLLAGWNVLMTAGKNITKGKIFD